MAKRCDNRSVGILIEEDGRWAVIKRRNYPEAWAMIAGHVDEHGGERDAIIAEAEEEGSLTLERFVQLPFGEDIDNPCKREGGSHHHWTVFGAYEWSGKLTASSDASEAHWVSEEELLRLAKRTKYFMRKYNTPWYQVGELTRAIFGTFDNPKTDPEWLEDMGLEPVWFYILEKLGKIPM